MLKTSEDRKEYLKQWHLKHKERRRASTHAIRTYARRMDRET